MPRGIKQNQYFVVDNTENIHRREQGKQAQYWDDCGAWSGKTRGFKTVFVCCDGGLKKVVERDGVLCLERRRNKKTVFLPLEEQPNKDSVLILHRYYQKHSLSASYEKRTSWLTKDCVPSGSNYVACVEYKGDFPGSVPHKKSENNKRNYVRLRPDVARDIKERVKTSKPSEIYETMRFKVAETGDTADAPRTHKLQRDKERTMQRWQ